MRKRMFLSKLSMIFISTFFLLSMPGGLICENGLTVKNADDFQTSETISVHGWNWLKQAGQIAEWTWKPIDVDPAEACLNFELLVTNKSNGGSGYSCRVKVIINDLEGNFVFSGTAMLSNPFRPKYPDDTNGVGYPAYGSFCGSKLGRILKKGFKARIEWPPPGSHNHFAVSRDKVTLAYVEGPSSQKARRERQK
jgi:hypothetical protein